MEVKSLKPKYDVLIEVMPLQEIILFFAGNYFEQIETEHLDEVANSFNSYSGIVFDQRQCPWDGSFVYFSLQFPPIYDRMEVAATLEHLLRSHQLITSKTEFAILAYPALEVSRYATLTDFIQGSDR